MIKTDNIVLGQDNKENPDSVFVQVNDPDHNFKDFVQVNYKDVMNV